jgi:hypothetical protein
MNTVRPSVMVLLRRVDRSEYRCSINNSSSGTSNVNCLACVAPCSFHICELTCAAYWTVHLLSADPTL